MIQRMRPPRRRRGAVAAETAVILILLLSFIFAIFEYGRLMMNWSLMDNAAREGCRYALVNNTRPAIAAEVEALVTNYMGGQTSNFQNFTVTVSGMRGGAALAVNDLGPGDPITVSVSGKFQFLNIIPLVQMPTSWTMTSTVTMLCEGGT